MDGFGNPSLSSTRPHNNNTSVKNEREVKLDAPVSVPVGEDAQPDNDAELNLLMEPLPLEELFSIDPNFNPSSCQAQADTQLCSGSNQLNQSPSSQAHANLFPATPYVGLDGTSMLRFRARRGQATDPHSIAERNRREKISDGTKKLHDLIPNSNMTVKASMFDEIISYIKFLQLQIKKPSGRMSSASAGSSSNASQKGKGTMQSELCLMPVELASAISIQKGTHTAAIPTEMQIMDSVLSGAPFFGMP